MNDVAVFFRTSTGIALTLEAIEKFASEHGCLVYGLVVRRAGSDKLLIDIPKELEATS